MASADQTKPDQAEAEEGIDFTKPWEYGDVVFIVEGQKVYANKMILSLCSPKMKEKFTDNLKEIELPGKKLSEIIDLMKTVHPPNKLTGLDLEKLVPLMHEYQMTYITEHCEKYLLQLTPSLGRLILADKYGLSKLRGVCLKYAMTLKIKDLEQDEMYAKVQPATKVTILTAEIKKLTSLSKPFQRSSLLGVASSPATNFGSSSGLFGVPSNPATNFGSSLLGVASSPATNFGRSPVFNSTTDASADQTKPDQAEVNEGIDFTKPWDHSDVVFIVKGQKVYANKMILSMSSPVMKAMFKMNFEEEDTGAIVIQEKEFDSFVQLMQAVHPPYQLKGSAIEKIVPLMHEYQMTHIIENCEKYLLQLKASIARLVLADLYGMPELREVCLEYAMKIPFEDLEQDEMYDQIEPTTKVTILAAEIGKITEEVTRTNAQAIQELATGVKQYPGNCETSGHRRGSDIDHCPYCKALRFDDIRKICKLNPI